MASEACFSKPVIEISVIVVQAIEIESRVLENMSMTDIRRGGKHQLSLDEVHVEISEKPPPPLALTQWTGRSSCLEE